MGGARLADARKSPGDQDDSFGVLHVLAPKVFMRVV
jgi:hypothetical protein